MEQLEFEKSVVAKELKSLQKRFDELLLEKMAIEDEYKQKVMENDEK